MKLGSKRCSIALGHSLDLLVFDRLKDALILLALLFSCLLHLLSFKVGVSNQSNQSNQEKNSTTEADWKSLQFLVLKLIIWFIYDE
ncbi:hypothetical protein Sjap_019413 [Stephania japonica]|uniref:Uncharacterized protein n=1 Tax=Stephania japonica TaxID=461633 RepID=A0AAP0F7M5_9MAGN